MQHSLKTTTYTGVILAILCCLTIYFFSWPQWTNQKVLKDSLKIAQTKNAQLQQTMALTQDFIRSYENNQKNIPTATLALPLKEPDLDNFITGINELAKSSGVSMATMQVEQDAQTTDKPALSRTLQSKTIHLEVSGDYLSFKDFVMRLEQFLRITDVQRVTVRADSTGVPQFNLTMKTYYQK